MSFNYELTIIIATYNAKKKLIENTLDSILNLELNQNIEIIILNSKSGYDIKDIIDKYISRLNILYFYRKDNGIYDAWNYGIKHVKSKWISFIGAGDIVDKKYFSNFINSNLNEKNIVSFNTNIIDMNKTTIRMIKGNFNKKKFIKYMSIPHVGLFHHINLFRDGNFNLNYKYASDYDFLLRKINLLKVLYINKTLVFMLNGGLTSYSFKTLIETLKIKLIHKNSNKINCYLDFVISFFKLMIRYLHDKIRYKI